MQPRRCLLMLTLWTVSMATGMGDVMRLSTTFADREARAVGAGAASADGVNGLVVRGREVGRAFDRLWGVGSEDVAHGDHDDLGKPQATRVIGQRLLPPLALVMVADLMASRLAHIDIGRTLPMRETNLVAHGLSPCCARCG